MNCLIVTRDQLVDAARARIVGAAATTMIAEHELSEGIEIRAALLGGSRGKARVAKCSNDEVILDLDLRQPPLERSGINWIVAISRPLTVKKVLQLAATLGIERVDFIRTSQVVKSYLQSPVLEEANLKAELIKGLQQSGDSIVPKVEVHKFFKPFITETLPGLLASRNYSCLIADSQTESTISSGMLKPGAEALLAIGPERGWSRDELQQFEGLGFSPLSLGPRLLRVDTACAYASAQIEALRPNLAPLK